MSIWFYCVNELFCMLYFISSFGRTGHLYLPKTKTTTTKTVQILNLIIYIEQNQKKKLCRRVSVVLITINCASFFFYCFYFCFHTQIMIFLYFLSLKCQTMWEINRYIETMMKKKIKNFSCCYFINYNLPNNMRTSTLSHCIAAYN